MGWFGYGIYDGDDTQTRHYNMIKNANLSLKIDNEIMMYGIEPFLQEDGTKIPAELLPQFKKGLKNVISNLPKVKYWDEDSSMEWHMFGALVSDNSIKINKTVKKKIISAAEYLMNEHASEFDCPKSRRLVLRGFIQEIKKL